MPTAVIALALSRSSIAGAVVCGDEALTATHRTVAPSAGIDEIVDLALDSATELRERSERLGRCPTAAGVVLPEADDAGGFTALAGECHWYGAPVRAWFEEHLDLPVTVGRDIRAGAWAEARLGAGRGSRTILYVPVNDRIPAVFVLHDRTPEESRVCVGDLGRLPTWARAAATGRSEPAEHLATPGALARRYEAARGTAGLTALAVYRRAKEGDDAAARVWNEAMEAFADALASAVMVLNPSRVVLGGELADADEAYYLLLRQAVAERVQEPPSPVIVPAQRGPQATLLGAALLTRGAPKDVEPLGGGPALLAAVPSPPRTG
ncbi:ROK family protein [Streptomyces aureus]|uniref:ROK family protein n=1 Tax=Streptomyces aureus TaxID=193461 RepID=UPI003402E7E8